MGRNKLAAVNSSQLARRGDLRDTADYKVETVTRSMNDILNTQ